MHAVDVADRLGRGGGDRRSREPCGMPHVHRQPRRGVHRCRCRARRPRVSGLQLRRQQRPRSVRRRYRHGTRALRPERQRRLRISGILRDLQRLYRPGSVDPDPDGDRSDGDADPDPHRDADTHTERDLSARQQRRQRQPFRVCLPRHVRLLRHLQRNPRVRGCKPITRSGRPRGRRELFLNRRDTDESPTGDRVIARRRCGRRGARSCGARTPLRRCCA